MTERTTLLYLPRRRRWHIKRATSCKFRFEKYCRALKHQKSGSENDSLTYLFIFLFIDFCDNSTAAHVHHMHIWWLRVLTQETKRSCMEPSKKKEEKDQISLNRYNFGEGWDASRGITKAKLISDWPCHQERLRRRRSFKDDSNVQLFGPHWTNFAISFAENYNVLECFLADVFLWVWNYTNTRHNASYKKAETNKK